MKYRCYLKARPVFPYIANVEAKNKTAAARMFLEDIKGYRNARTSVSTVNSFEITDKKAELSGIRIIDGDPK